MYNPQLIQERIKERLKSMHITQKALLKSCGLGINYISQLSNNSNVSCCELLSIAENLNCSLDFLLGRTDNPNISGIHQEINAGRDNYGSNIANSSQYPNDTLDLLNLIQNIPTIERAKLIYELDLKYNHDK